jgi:ankyrin repeat protein
MTIIDDQLYLKAVFADILNFESDNIFDPIDPLIYRTPEGHTCLHLAAFRGNIRAISLLARAGLDINAKGDMGSTPLHMAYSGNQAEAIAFLLALGANPELRDEFGCVPKDCQVK